MKILNCTIRVRGDCDADYIAITFDDGPHPRNTSQILELLEENGGLGTFFVTGNNLKKNWKLAENLASRGHMLGNHTFSHCNALFCSKKKLQREIAETKALIENITQKPNNFFRPPHGIITPSLLSICRKLNLTVVLWSANTLDFKRESPRRMFGRVEKKVRKGAIVLFHECHFKTESLDYSNSIKALGTVLDLAKGKGLKPVRLDTII